MDSTTQTNESQDTYPNAGRDSGYTDDGGKPVGENIINQVTILIAGIQTSLIAVRSDIAEIARKQTETDLLFRQTEGDTQYRASHLYQRMGAFLTDADARFQRYDAFFATAEEAVAVAGKAYALAEEVAAGQAELAGIVSDQGEKIDEVDARLMLVEATPGTSPDLARRITILSYSVGMLVLLWILILIATLLQ